MLLLMFIGYGPIDRLTTAYGRICTGRRPRPPRRPHPAPARRRDDPPAQTAMAPQH